MRSFIKRKIDCLCVLTNSALERHRSLSLYLSEKYLHTTSESFFFFFLFFLLNYFFFHSVPVPFEFVALFTY